VNIVLDTSKTEPMQQF